MSRAKKIIIKPLSPKYTPPKAPTTNPYKPTNINVGDPIRYERGGEILEGVVEGYDDIVVESQFDTIEPAQTPKDILDSETVENDEISSVLESDERLDIDNSSIVEYDNETGLIKYQGRPSNKQIQGLLDNFPSPYLDDFRVIFYKHNQRVIADADHPGLKQYSEDQIAPFLIKPGEPGYVENRTTYNVPINAQNSYGVGEINGNAPTSSFIEDARVEPIYKRLKPNAEFGTTGIDPQLGELIDNQTSVVERFATEQLGWTLPYNSMELFAKYYMLEKFPSQMLQDFPQDRYPHIHEIKNLIDRIKEVDIELPDIGLVSPAGEGLYPSEVLDRFDGYVKATKEKVVPSPLANNRDAGRKLTSEDSSISYSLQSLTDLQRQRMVSSGRSKGFTGKTPVSWEYAKEILSKNDKVLDYGAGKNAVQSQELAEKGYDITPYDLPENQVKGLHDMNALRDRYKYTVASNVLNVQPNPSAVLDVLEEIYDTLEPGGSMIANYPTSPRYTGMTAGAIKQLIEEAGFTSPEIVGGTNQSPVFKAIRPATGVRRLDEIAETFIDVKKQTREETISTAVAKGVQDIIEVLSDPTFEIHQTLEWYREAVGQAYDLVATEVPIIKESPSHKSLLTAAIAITSQATKLAPNFNHGVEAFKRWLSDGKFNLKPNAKGFSTLRVLNAEGKEITAGATRSPALGTNIQKIDKLIEKMGLDRAMDWLNTPHSGGELVDFLQSIGMGGAGIQKGRTFYGSRILGNKIGRYYDNLVGRHDLAVYDLWFARMWARWMGMPFKTNKAGEIVLDNKGRPQIVGAPEGARIWDDMDVALNTIKDTLTKATGYSWGVDQVQAVLWYVEKALWEKHGAKPEPGINYLDAAIERAQRKGYIDEFATSESSQRAIRNTLKRFIESPEGNRFLERGASAAEPYITKKIKDDVTFSIKTGGRVEPAIFTSSIPDAIDKLMKTGQKGIKYQSYKSLEEALVRKGASKNELLWMARLPFWLEAQGYKIGDKVPLLEIREYVDGLTNVQIVNMTERRQGYDEVIAKTYRSIEPNIEPSALNNILERLSKGTSVSEIAKEGYGTDEGESVLLIPLHMNLVEYKTDSKPLDDMFVTLRPAESESDKVKIFTGIKYGDKSIESIGITSRDATVYALIQELFKDSMELVQHTELLPAYKEAHNAIEEIDQDMFPSEREQKVSYKGYSIISSNSATGETLPPSSHWDYFAKMVEVKYREASLIDWANAPTHESREGILEALDIGRKINKIESQGLFYIQYYYSLADEGQAASPFRITGSKDKGYFIEPDKIKDIEHSKIKFETSEAAEKYLAEKVFLFRDNEGYILEFESRLDKIPENRFRYLKGFIKTRRSFEEGHPWNRLGDEGDYTGQDVAAHVRGFSAIDQNNEKHLHLAELQTSVTNQAARQLNLLAGKLDDLLGTDNAKTILSRGDKIFWNNPILPSHINQEMDKAVALVQRFGALASEQQADIKPSNVNSLLAFYGIKRTGAEGRIDRFDLKTISDEAKTAYVEAIKQIHRLQENKFIAKDSGFIFQARYDGFADWFFRRAKGTESGDKDLFLGTLTISDAPNWPIVSSSSAGTTPVQAGAMDFMKQLTPVVLRDIARKKPRYLSVTNGTIQALTYRDYLVDRVGEGTLYYRVNKQGQYQFPVESEIPHSLDQYEVPSMIKKKVGNALAKRILKGEFDTKVTGSRENATAETKESVDVGSFFDHTAYQNQQDGINLNPLSSSGYQVYNDLSLPYSWTDPLRQKYFYDKSDKFYMIEMDFDGFKLKIARFGNADKMWSTPERVKASFKKYVRQHVRDVVGIANIVGDVRLDESTYSIRETGKEELELTEGRRDIFNALTGRQVRDKIIVESDGNLELTEVKAEVDIGKAAALAQRYDGTNLVMEAGDTTLRFTGLGADAWREISSALGRPPLPPGSSQFDMVWGEGDAEDLMRFSLDLQEIYEPIGEELKEFEGIKESVDYLFGGMYYKEVEHRIEQYDAQKSQIGDMPWIQPIADLIKLIKKAQPESSPREWLGIDVKEPVWAGTGLHKEYYGDPMAGIKKASTLNKVAKEIKKLTGVKPPVVTTVLGYIDRNNPDVHGLVIKYMEDAGVELVDATGEGAKNHYPITHVSLDLKDVPLEKLGGADITFSLGDGSREQLPDSDYSDLYKVPEDNINMPELTPRYKKDNKGGLVSDWFIPISTRLRRINPSLETILRKFTYNTGTKVVQRFEVVTDFKKKVWNKFKRSQRDVLNLALLNSDMKKIDELIGTLPEGQIKGVYKSFADIRNLLDEIRREGIEVGYEIGEIADYFPRWINNYDKLVDLLSKDEKSRGVITDALLAAEEKAGRELTREEKSNAVNNVIRGTGPQTGVAPGSTKERVIQVLDKDMVRYYNNAMDALIRHVENWTEAIERQRLFGKGERTGDDIADAVAVMMEEGVVGPEQQSEVIDILRAFFNTKPTNVGIASLKSLLYVYTMGSVSSAITQIGDVAWSIAHAGLPRTLAGVAKSAMNKGQVKMEDVGITNIAAELSSLGKLNKYLNAQFKLIGLSSFDRLFKNTMIEASLLKHRNYAKKITSKKSFLIFDKSKKQRFYTRMVELFGEDKAVDVIQDLAKGNVTEDIKFLLLCDILDHQPAAYTEVPQAYLNSPNGRIFYMLKTFTLKQFDIYRRKGFDEVRAGYQQISEGNVKKGSGMVAAGVASLVNIMVLFLLTQTSSNKAKDWLMGRENDLEDAFVDATYNVFGVSRYLTYVAKRYGLATAVIDSVLPPVKGMVDKTARDIERLQEWWNGTNNWESTNLELTTHVPIVDIYNIPAKFANKYLEDRKVPYIPAGKMYYWWFGGGKARSLDREMDNTIKKSKEGYINYKDMGEVNAALTLFNQNLKQQVELGAIEEADRMKKITSFLNNIRNSLPLAIKESFYAEDAETEALLRDLHTKVIERMLELNLISRQSMGRYKNKVSRSNLSKIKTEEEKEILKEEKTEKEVKEFLEAEEKI